MTDELRTLAENVTPTTTNELLRMAEVAGQLGTKSTADLLNLVSAADALELSTNLAGDEAATLLARILGMTKEGIPQIQNLSSSVVALGNDFAITESEIAHMTKEIVSGTREINLGSAAAAAFGTTLGELGQPAERSRTAIQRLAGAINEASKQGGDDLERLTKITGLTAKQIETDLGTAPEKVLVGFLKGLARVKDEGGLVSDTLKSMGIDGTEATGVLSVLSDGVGRLETALALSNKAFEAGDYHMKEAAKSYATQESALGRLSNKFKTLTTDIGEAFADETDLAIRATGDALLKVNDDVVKLMERLPELVEGFAELVKSMDNFAGTFSDDNLGILEKSFDRIKLGVNAISITFNTLTLGVQGTLMSLVELTNKAKDLAGLKVDTTFIDELRIKMQITREAIEKDYKDMGAAAARMKGESSISFEGLIDIAEQYKGAIGRLGVEQQATLAKILESNTYNAESEKIYRELTAAIVLANRQIEIENELKEQAKKTAEQKNDADKIAP